MMIIRRTATVVSTVSIALALAGCSNGMKKTFGLEANPPNAYEVGTLPPLALPPELGQLPQPNPGQAPTQEVSAAQQGANIVAPGNALVSNNKPISPAGQALLAQAGPAPAANIRAEVNQNAAVTSRSGGFLDRLLNGSSTNSTVLNANAEQSRLQENAALGQPVTSGNTPDLQSEAESTFKKLEHLFLTTP